MQFKLVIPGSNSTNEDLHEVDKSPSVIENELSFIMSIRVADRLVDGSKGT